ncbi:MAG: protein kinase [Bryobacteraceae bacterium]
MSTLLSGRYELRDEIGRGGLGVVYAGWDRVIGREVAVKVIPLGFRDDPGRENRRQWVLREAQAAGGLSHPNIVTVHDAGEEGEDAYIVMELVRGRSAAAEIEAQKRLQPRMAARIARECAAALDYAHAKGVFHRDIKPANILLQPDGSAKLVDFGLARMTEATKLTQTGVLIGTPQYMSPEQLQGLKVEGPSDQFSLAVSVYEMLTGAVPFEGEGLVFQILNAQPPPVTRTIVTLPKSVDGAIAKAMAKEPRGRYGSCGDFAESLEHAVGAGQGPSRSRGWIPLSVAGAAVAAGLGAWIIFTPRPATQRETPAIAPTKAFVPEPPKTEEVNQTPVQRPEPVKRTTMAAPPRETPAPAQPQPAVERKAPPAAGSGTIIWSGTLAPGEEVAVDGTRCSAGMVTRALPGEPVEVRVTPATVQLTEAPSAAGQWRQWRVKNTGTRELDGFIITYTPAGRP